MSQGISLAKGGRIDLTKTAPSLTRVRIGLKWKANKFDSGTDFDVDGSIFGCHHDAQGEPKLIGNNYFVFYGNPSEPEKAITHHGDNTKGCASTDPDQDTETVTVELAKLNPAITELSIIVTIHEAIARKQTFGMIDNCRVRLYDDVTGAVITTYDLSDDFSSETAVQFGSLYKKDAAWMFKAVGQGFNKGLGEFVVAYGGSLA